MDRTDGNLDVLFIDDNGIYLCHLPVVLLASNMLFFGVLITKHDMNKLILL